MSTNVLKGVDIVVLEFHSTTGRRKLRENDIEIGVGGKLPSDKVASLGAKKVIDPEALKPFQTLKKKAERLLEQHAIKMFGGFAVPRNKTSAISVELDQIKADYNGYRDTDFLPNYERGIEAWIGANPEFERQLREAVYTVDQVRNRIWSSFSIFRVEAAESAGDFAETVKSMGDKLLEEIAAEADKIYERSIQGHDESVSQRIKKPIGRLREKLAGLSFLEEASVDPMIETIDKVLDGLPESGAITGLDYHRVTQLILILSDPDKVRKHGSGAIDLQAEAEAALGFVPLDQVPAKSVAAPRPGRPDGVPLLSLLDNDPSSRRPVLSEKVPQTRVTPAEETAIHCVVCNALVSEGKEVDDFYCSQECADNDPQYASDAGAVGTDDLAPAPMPARVPDEEPAPVTDVESKPERTREEPVVHQVPRQDLPKPGEIDTALFF